MKILAVYRHYWPDRTPYARLLRLILERLAAEGHEVTVFTAQPSYNDTRGPRSPWRETLGGVRVVRTALLPERKRWPLVRTINSVWFLAAAVLDALRSRPALTLANGHPPVAMGVALRVIGWLTGAPYVLHLQDLHPEAAEAVGKLRPKRLFNLLRRLDAASCRHAAAVVTLSADMRASLIARGEAPANLHVINNCPLPSFEEPSAPAADERPRDGRTRLLFAGNLGDFQALDAVAASTRLVTDPGAIELTFMGAGSVAARLPQLASPAVARFVGSQPLAAATAAMAAADFGLVTLAPGVIRYAYPSKTLAYLAAGTPIVAVVEPDSELAEMIRRHGLGIVADGADPASIARAFDQAAARRAEWTPERRRQIAEFAQREFGPERMLAAWSLLVHDLGKPARATTLRMKRAA